jgi:PhnB protein
MSTKAKPVPEGFHTVTPYLIIKGAAAAIEFYKKAFGATEILRHTDPSGRIGHAQIKIGNSFIMMGEQMETPGVWGNAGSSMMMYVYVEDVDALFNRAVAAGGKAIMPVTDMFYGDRSGALTDPFGHVWCLATHKEDIPEEEMQRRGAAAMAARKQ